MNGEQHQSNRSTATLATLCLSPALGGEIIHWNKTRIEFERQWTKQNQDRYCKSCDELGQALCQWRVEQPELFEQFALWFQSQALNSRGIVGETL